MKITTLEESIDCATLDTEKLFSKLKSHELSHKGHLNHDASFSSKALISSALLVAMMLTSPTLLSHLICSSPCLLWLQLLMSSMRASQMMRLPCWRESPVPCISSARREGDHLGAASSAATSHISLPTAPRGRSSTPPTSTTTPTGMTPVTRAKVRRSTALGIRRRRRSFRRSSSEHVLP
jgi:hypothetical protein